MQTTINEAVSSTWTQADGSVQTDVTPAQKHEVSSLLYLINLSGYHKNWTAEHGWNQGQQTVILSELQNTWNQTDVLYILIHPSV